MSLKEIWMRLRRIILFGMVYLTVFFFMEARDVPIHIIHTKFDDMVPFCEYFIIPYAFWYIYVCATVLYLGLTDRRLKEYNRLISNMIAGMIVFVAVSLIYPNGQNLRPDLVVDSIFTWAVNLLYTVDTSTNILPSLHVFVSVACDIALCRDKRFRDYPVRKAGIHVLTTLICLSTMFLKQHSVIDVVAALFLNTLFYPFIYYKEYFSLLFLKKKPLNH